MTTIRSVSGSIVQVADAPSTVQPTMASSMALSVMVGAGSTTSTAILTLPVNVAAGKVGRQLDVVSPRHDGFAQAVVIRLHVVRGVGGKATHPVDRIRGELRSDR